jgi:branched-subunit amino acid transport protein
MSTVWTVVLGSAAATFAIKAAGPVAMGGRELPGAFTRVIDLLAPALLSALVVVSALADGRHLAIGADTAGVAAATLVMLRTRSILPAIVVAAAVTAALRATLG